MYVYNDEDNAPMNDFDFHNPTVYGSLAEMKWFESRRFTEQDEYKKTDPDDDLESLKHWGNRP